MGLKAIGNLTHLMPLFQGKETELYNKLYLAMCCIIYV